MDKVLTFPTQTDRGIFLYVVGEGRDQGYLEKSASAEFHPEIAKYIDAARPVSGKTQVLLTALGSGDYWGSNVNGDYFPTAALENPTPDYGYKTFEKLAKVYKHHVNKNPEKSYGDVALSVWNEKMKRVELIVILDHAKAPDLVERIDNGEYPEVSMGCKVPFDVCSICGNKARTRAQYCDHLRYHMNKIPPGYQKKACAINTRPKFFDISFVLIGADRIAKVMKKVAHLHPQYGVSSAQIADTMEKTAYGLSHQKVAAKKLAEIRKEIPSNIEPNTVKTLEDMGRKGKEALEPLEPKMNKQVIIRITSGNSGMDGLNKILSTLTSLGIVPKKEEFQSIALRSLGRSDLADDYERRGLVFGSADRLSPVQRCACNRHLDISPSLFDHNVFSNVRPMLADRSYSRPLLHNRVIRLVKMAEEGRIQYPKQSYIKIADDDSSKVPSIMMLTLAGLWSAFGKKAPNIDGGKLERLFQSFPGITTALGIGAVAGFNELFARKLKGKYDFNPDKGPQQSLSWQDEIKRKNANPFTKTSGIASRLLLGTPLIYMGSGIQTVDRYRNPNKEESFIGKTLRKHPDVLSAGLVGEAMAGYPVTKHLSKLFGKFANESGLSLLRKTAEIGDDLQSAAIFSLAFPGKSMALRTVTNAVDYGIISGIEKLLRKTEKNRPKIGG